MTEADSSNLRKVLIFAAAAQAATGLALMVIPSIAIPLLVEGSITDLTLVIGRCMGVALLALGMACWPTRDRSVLDRAACRAMLTYNLLIAVFFSFLGAVVQVAGPLLWPAAVIHAIIALLLWTLPPDAWISPKS